MRVLFTNNGFALRAGSELYVHAIGMASGVTEPDPGSLLTRYDVVFAKARSAIEAMATRTAVVLCAPGRVGTMVSSDNFALYRRSISAFGRFPV